MNRLFIYILSFILMFNGKTTILLYINLFNFGYTLKEYILYILKLKEFYFFIIGFILFNINIYKGRKNVLNK